MPDWVTEHKASLQYVVWTITGLALILVGLVNEREPAMIALGAGAIGLPGHLGRNGET